MGDRFINSYGDVDVSTIALSNNLYYNGGSALPTTETPAPGADAQRVEGDPLLASPTNIELPVWDESQHAFASGSTTIRQELERLVNTYGAIGAGSPAVDKADASKMPPDDILGRPRGAKPDIGAFEHAASPATDGTPTTDGPAAGDAPTAGDSSSADSGGSSGDGSGSVEPDDDGCGCQTSGGWSGVLGLSLLLLFFFVLARRRSA